MAIALLPKKIHEKISPSKSEFLLITKTQNTCFGLLIVAIGIPVYYGKKYFAKPE